MTKSLTNSAEESEQGYRIEIHKHPLTEAWRRHTWVIYPPGRSYQVRGGFARTERGAMRKAMAAVKRLKTPQDILVAEKEVK
jgi:hypothetical protein